MEREANLVNSYPTFGSPVDLAYNQAGRISDKTDATGRPYESVLWVEYRRLAFFLSPKEYIKEYLGRAYETYETTALEDTPFDYALLAKGKIIQGYIWFRGRRFWNWTITMAMQI